MKPISAKQEKFYSFDGSPIAYYVMGSGKPLLICNGIMGNWQSWSHQIRFLSEHFKIITWDYRGLYNSSLPNIESRPPTVFDHAMDAIHLLHHLDAKVAPILGWSFGVQVGLEIYKMAAENIPLFVAINGGHGRLKEFSYRLKILGAFGPVLQRNFSKIPFVKDSTPHKILHQPEFIQWAKRMGLLAQNLDDDLFADTTEKLFQLENFALKETFAAMYRYDGSEIIKMMNAPFLVINGERDWLTPRKIIEQLVRDLPNAELLSIPDGSHYCMMEFPDLINLRIEKFLKERDYGFSNSILPPQES